MERESVEGYKVEVVNVIEANYEWNIPNFMLDQRYVTKFELPRGFGTM